MDGREKGIYKKDIQSGRDERMEKARLKRDIERFALIRLEEAARTADDFRAVVAWWDRLDANRERRERYHEILRSGDGLPLDDGAAPNGLYFPRSGNRLPIGAVQKGDFLDAIHCCPYELHELVAEEYLSRTLEGLKEGQKEMLFLCVMCRFSSVQAAAIRGQTDRNIRKTRASVLKKIRKEALSAVRKKEKRNLPMTLEEKMFLAENDSPG